MLKNLLRDQAWEVAGYYFRNLIHKRDWAIPERLELIDSKHFTSRSSLDYPITLTKYFQKP
jgi:hypothetical protein